jgi:hypothetical protein
MVASAMEADRGRTSPGGQQIVFHRTPPNQMFMMRSTLNPDGSKPTATQLTSEGLNILANWGALEAKDS